AAQPAGRRAGSRAPARRSMLPRIVSGTGGRRAACSFEASPQGRERDRRAPRMGRAKSRRCTRTATAWRSLVRAPSHCNQRATLCRARSGWDNRRIPLAPFDSPMTQFERLFDPRGIAVIGASADPTRAGGQTVDALARNGFAGAVYPVNPRYREIGAWRCYAAPEDIDGPCDVAVIALPAAQAPEMVERCGQRGIAYGAVLGGGFRETGADGEARERALVQAARTHGMRLIGPNCLGFVSTARKVYAGFGSLVREPTLHPGPVSAVVQSGGFGNSLVIRCALAGVGFRHVVMSGNEADITAP